MHVYFAVPKQKRLSENTTGEILLSALSAIKSICDALSV